VIITCGPHFREFLVMKPILGPEDGKHESDRTKFLTLSYLLIFYCSLSLWRVIWGSKLMHLDLIHGLFITQTQFRLLSTSTTAFMYTYTDYNIHGAIPLLFISPCCFPFASLSSPLYLLVNPPSCDRIRPPWSQVACKLTSPFSTLSQSLPHPISPNPGC
jgi:hypothetical protein